MTRTSHILARIGIAAATITAPLVFPAPAKADPARERLWDRVAMCESGGNWNANTGNGYYGGLQFTRSTWNSFGGRAYARTANYATRLQQIDIAEKVLHVQGWDAGQPARSEPESANRFGALSCAQWSAAHTTTQTGII